MKRIVIALGGNALGDNPKEQLAQINQAAPAMVEMIKLGYEIIISHGNGPQVGMLEKAINMAANLDSSIPHVQLPECTATSLPGGAQIPDGGLPGCRGAGHPGC